MIRNVVYVHGIGDIGGAEKDLLSYLCLQGRPRGRRTYPGRDTTAQ